MSGFDPKTTEKVHVRCVQYLLSARSCRFSTPCSSDNQKHQLHIS